MTVTLSAEWTEYIGKQMATGTYNSVEEVLDAALRVWRRHANDTERNGEALRSEAEALNDELKAGVTTGREYPAIRAAVQVGIDQLDRGEGIPGDVVREEMLQRSTARRLAQQ